MDFLKDMLDIAVEYGPMFLRGAGVTLFIAILSTILGTLIGLIVGVIRTIPRADKGIKRVVLKIVDFLLACYIEFFRGTPMMVQAMVIFYGTPLLFGYQLNVMGAAIFIVTINTGAYMAEIVRGGIISIDKGQFEAAQAIGMTHVQTMVHIVLPQVIRNILPATGNEFVINIKDTSVLSIISVTELFFQTRSVSGVTFKTFETFLIAALIYLVMTFTVTRILRFIERKMDGKEHYDVSGNQMQV